MQEKHWASARNLKAMSDQEFEQHLVDDCATSPVAMARLRLKRHGLLQDHRVLIDASQAALPEETRKIAYSINGVEYVC